jgi:hypothetical protein
MKRTSVSISESAAAKLRDMQSEFERKLGFEPSLAQIVELLIKEYADTNRDNVTIGQHVE